MPDARNLRLVQTQLYVFITLFQDLKLYEKWKTNSNLLLMEYWEHKLGDCDQIKPLLGLEKNLTIKSDEFINGESDREGQRIRHILVIIRNICQDQRDIHFIRRSELVLKFLLRCSFIKNDIGLGKCHNIRAIDFFHTIMLQNICKIFIYINKIYMGFV